MLSIFTITLFYFLISYFISSLFSLNFTRSITQLVSSNFECGFVSFFSSLLRFRISYFIIIINFLLFEIEFILVILFIFSLSSYLISLLLLFLLLLLLLDLYTSFSSFFLNNSIVMPITSDSFPFQSDIYFVNYNDPLSDSELENYKNLFQSVNIFPKSDTKRSDKKVTKQNVTSRDTSSSSSSSISSSFPLLSYSLPSHLLPSLNRHILSSPSFTQSLHSIYLSPSSSLVVVNLFSNRLSPSIISSSPLRSPLKPISFSSVHHLHLHYSHFPSSK